MSNWLWKDIEQCTHCWGKCKMLQMLWKKVWKFVTKLTTLLPYEVSVPPVGPYLKEMNTWRKIFTAALFIIGKSYQKPNYPSLSDEVNYGIWISWTTTATKGNKQYACMSQTLCWEKETLHKSTYCILTGSSKPGESNVY